MDYLATHPRIRNHDGEIGSLIVAFRNGGKAYLYKERIASYGGKVVRDDGQSVRWSLSDNGDALLYSGTCRNFIKVNGHRAVEITGSEEAALNNLGAQARSLQITSADQLGDIAMRLEQALSETSKNHSSDPNVGDIIGPPFQSAILPADSSKWITTFENPCQ